MWESKRWSIFPALGLSLAAIALLLPRDSSGLVVTVWAILCSLAILSASWRLRSTTAAGVYFLIGFAGLIFIVGIAVRTIHGEQIGVESPVPSPADLLHVPAYLLMLWATLRVHRRRAIRRDFDAWLDSMSISLGVLAVLWTLFLGDFVLGTDDSALKVALHAGYNVIVFSMLAVTLRIGATPGSRPASYYLLGASVVAFLVADLAATQATTAGRPIYIATALSPLIYGLSAASALHPSARQLTTPVVESEERGDQTRIVVVALALASPTAVAAIAQNSVEAARLALVLGSLVLAVLVTWRIVRLLRLHMHIADQERRLAELVTHLAEMQSPAEISAALPATVQVLLPPGHKVIVSDDKTPDSLPLGSLETDEGSQIAIHPPLMEARQSRFVETLVRDASLLARAAEGIEATTRRRTEDQANFRIAQNEKRFRALVQHASDIIVVVDEVGIVQYVSEPIEAALGYKTDEFLGQTLNWVVKENDQAAAEAYFAATLKGLARDAVHEFRATAKDGEVHLFETVMTDMRSTEAVEGIVLNCSDVTDRRNLERDLRDAETIDMLTLLLNRNAFIEETNQALRHASISAAGVAIAIIDLDNFREINEGFGPVVADLTLVEVAQRLRRAVRVGDAVARLNGDEFAVLMPESISDAEAEMTVARILENVCGTALVHGREVAIAASAGIARDTDGEVLATRLLRNADTALGNAKQNALGQVVLFDESMADAVTAKIEIRNQLEHAIASDGMRLVYQPIVDTQTQEIVSMEGLARWRHKGENISPGTFIPIAEESNLIGQLGEWAFRQACNQLVAWKTDGWDSFTLSVNMSGHQLQEEGIITRIENILEETGADPERMIIEITESVLIDETNFIQERLSRMRELGLKIAIDDFGTGYSSLSYLQRYEFDVLKIDRSFVTQLANPKNTRDREIVSSMISLARGLGAITVAEGIEEEAEYVALRSLECDRIQGFYFHRPSEVSDIDDLLRRNPGKVQAAA